jgi:hypothetical protein
MYCEIGGKVNLYFDFEINGLLSREICPWPKGTGLLNGYGKLAASLFNNPVPLGRG